MLMIVAGISACGIIEKEETYNAREVYDVLLQRVMDEYGVQSQVGETTDMGSVISSPRMVTGNDNYKLHNYSTTLAFGGHGHTIDDYLRPVPGETNKYSARWKYGNLYIEVKVSIDDGYGTVWFSVGE
jgi:hypothetical protein